MSFAKECKSDVVLDLGVCISMEPAPEAVMTPEGEMVKVTAGEALKT